jgi:hypothetical protein
MGNTNCTYRVSAIHGRIARAKKADKEVSKEAARLLESFIGKPVKYIDSASATFEGGGTGTAIAYDNRTIYIMDRGVAAKIPFDSVRSWRWVVDGYQVTKLYGNFDSLTLLKNEFDSLRARVNAIRKSGLFITVANIEHPEWQFMTTDMVLLKKWMEIFRQVQEGREV